MCNLEIIAGEHGCLEFHETCRNRDHGQQCAQAPLNLYIRYPSLNCPKCVQLIKEVSTYLNRTVNESKADSPGAEVGSFISWQGTQIKIQAWSLSSVNAATDTNENEAAAWQVLVRPIQSIFHGLEESGPEQDDIYDKASDKILEEWATFENEENAEEIKARLRGRYHYCVKNALVKLNDLREAEVSKLSK